VALLLTWLMGPPGVSLGAAAVETSGECWGRRKSDT
jgi:hypothetical protein